MSTKVILLLNADPDVAPVALNATMETRHRLRTMHTCKESFHFLDDHIDEVDAVILDLDPGIHGMALLNALDICMHHIPVITLTSYDPTYIKPVIARRGAAECLGKPVTVRALVAAINACTCPAGADNLPAQPGAERSLDFTRTFVAPE